MVPEFQVGDLVKVVEVKSSGAWADLVGYVGKVTYIVKKPIRGYRYALEFPKDVWITIECNGHSCFLNGSPHVKSNCGQWLDEEEIELFEPAVKIELNQEELLNLF